MSGNAAVAARPTRSLAVCPARSCRAASWARAAASITSRAYGSHRAASSVRATGRLARSNRRSPSVFSSCAIPSLSVCCTTLSLRAALVKLSSSATTTNLLMLSRLGS